MTSKNNRAPLLSYSKLCVSFHNHRWIQTRVTVRKLPLWVKIGDFWFPVTLKFDGWIWKTIGHLVYATSSFGHHFRTIGSFKLELQSGNAQFGSKSAIFLNWVPNYVTLAFDLWLWPFAWTLLLSIVISPENFMMIRWEEHSEKGVTDWQTDIQTDIQTDGWTDRQKCS